MGAAYDPQWVQGKALVGGPAGQSPTEALGFKHLINKFPKKRKIFMLYFFTKGLSVRCQLTPLYCIYFINDLVIT